MLGNDGVRILGNFWKKAVSWDLNLEEASWFSNLGEARPVGSTRCAARGGVRWNSQHNKYCVSLSSKVLLPSGVLGFQHLKVKKVIKVSYLNKESRQCFAYFGISMHVNVLRINILYRSERFRHLYICTFHILHFEYATWGQFLKWRSTGKYSKFSFSRISCLNKIKVCPMINPQLPGK